MRAKMAVAATLVSAALFPVLPLSPRADHHIPEVGEEAAEEEGGVSDELYQASDYRLARPGQRPVSNFYTLPGFQSVDPGCYSGGVSLETHTTHPAFPTAVLTIFEQIRVRPTRRGGRFNQRYHWELYSDPFELMGVVTTSEGGDSGRARVWLTVNLQYGIYRLVTDVQPRAGVYTISSSGAGISRMAFEDLFLGFADHHYSYVDLSGLQGGGAATAAALADIAAILSNRPPNVFMGFFDYIRETGWDGEEYLSIEDNERIALDYGVSVRGERSINLRIFCTGLVRRFGG